VVKEERTCYYEKRLSARKGGVHESSNAQPSGQASFLHGVKPWNGRGGIWICISVRFELFLNTGENLRLPLGIHELAWRQAEEGPAGSSLLEGICEILGAEELVPGRTQIDVRLGDSYVENLEKITADTLDDNETVEALVYAVIDALNASMEIPAERLDEDTALGDCHQRKDVAPVYGLKDFIITYVPLAEYDEID
jgi:hypothetical protein